jgi:hypothetical protein
MAVIELILRDLEMDFFQGENFASKWKIKLFFKYNISSDLKSVVLNQIGHTKYE